MDKYWSYKDGTWLSDTAATSTSRSYQWTPYNNWYDLESAWCDYMSRENRNRIERNQTYKLPDGAQLVVDENGNYVIDDSKAKVIYQANRLREFSPQLNASDMLAEFVKYAGSLGVRREDVLHLPIHLFVSWLIIEAAERDGDDIPDDVVPVAMDPSLRQAVCPRCLSCGRFIKKLHHRNRFPFCDPSHAVGYLEHQSAG